MGDRQEDLRRRLEGLGFDEVRFVGLSSPLGGGGLSRWLAAGFHADMHWMERSFKKRMEPGLVLEGAKTAIFLGVNYLDRTGEGKAIDGPRWARYSLYRDYHDSFKPALESAGRLLEELFGSAPSDYRYYVDTGPVLERAWAARAGLGFVGKNSMLISRRHGNWLFLASLLTRIEFDADPPIRRRGQPEAVGLLCGKCTRCMDQCPTRAFPSPGVVDARRCISYQTIENKGIIPAELRHSIGNRVYGCDTCLEVCPWNRFAQQGRRLILSARNDIAQLSLMELLELTPERFAEVFRGTPIKRVKLVGLLRNACVAAGNSGDKRLAGSLAKLAMHPSPIVRAHAVWAVRKLGEEARLTELRRGESDALVLEEYGRPRA